MAHSTAYKRAWQNYGSVPLPEDAVTHIHGFNAEVQAYYQPKPFISVGLEPAFARRGAACVPGWNQVIDPIFSGDSRFLLDYVEAPLMIQGHFYFFKRRFQIAPSIGYGWSAMVQAREDVINLDTDEIEITRDMEIGGISNLNSWDHWLH